MSQDERDVEKGVEGDAVGTRRELPTAAWVVIAVAALAIGVAAGHFLLGGVGTVSLSGRTTLSAGELDSTIATYTVNGTTTPITAREVGVERRRGAHRQRGRDLRRPLRE